MRWSTPTYVGNITAELARVRSWCNVSSGNTTDDTDLHDMLLIACGEVGSYQRRQLLSATFTVYLQDWPSDGVFVFRDHAPVTAVSAVKYKEATAGTLTTITASNYLTEVSTYDTPARILPISSYSWPTLYTDAVDRVQLTVTAGYGSTESIPMTTRGVLRALVAHSVSYRGDDPEAPPRWSDNVKAAANVDCWGFYG